MRFLLVFIIMVVTLGAIHAKENVVTCYMDNGSLKPLNPLSEKGYYKVEYINARLCTHLIYGFAVYDESENKIKSANIWIDQKTVSRKEDPSGCNYNEPCKAGDNFNNFIALKDNNPGLKTLVAIGGMGNGNGYSNLVASESKMDEFITNAIKFLTDHKFDGLDLDWEYPGSTGNTQDKPNFARWVSKLRTAFDKHNKENGNEKKQLMLTAAVMSQYSHAEKGYDIENLCKNLDLIQLMTYDIYGAWIDKETDKIYKGTTVDHHSPLKERKNSTETSVNLWIDRGCAKEKLVIGIPLYGRSYTLSDKNKHDIGASASGQGTPGPILKKNGLMGYLEICTHLKNDKWTKVKGTDDIGPYAYGMDPVSKQYIWVGYDDKDMAQKKAKYAKDKGLAGVMVWSIDYEDHDDFCGGGKYPVLKALSDELLTKSACECGTDGTCRESCFSNEVQSGECPGASCKCCKTASCINPNNRCGTGGRCRESCLSNEVHVQEQYGSCYGASCKCCETVACIKPNSGCGTDGTCRESCLSNEVQSGECPGASCKCCKTDGPLNIEIGWPMGTYGLPKTTSGCPEGTGFSWVHGWRYQDSEDINNGNDFSKDNHIFGTQNSQGIAQHFCIKETFNSGGSYWPRGQYCIFKYGECPSGMTSGYVKWDDEDDNNANRYSGTMPGTVPNGDYGRDTMIYYCCMTNGNYLTPIVLPTLTSFILFPYSSSGCQLVKGMSVQEEYINWDLEDDGTSITTFSDPRPYGYIYEDVKLYYCYYY